MGAGGALGRHLGWAGKWCYRPKGAPAETKLPPAARCSQHHLALPGQEAVAMLKYALSVREVLVPRCVGVCAGVCYRASCVGTQGV